MEKKIETIPLDAVVHIEIGGGFYTRLHQLRDALLAHKTAEEINIITEELKKGSTTHPVAYHLETVLTLMKEFEDVAREKNLLKLIDPPSTT
jgi:hypothetical protein